MINKRRNIKLKPLSGGFSNFSVVFFVLFFVLTVWAFWTSYYGKLFSQMNTPIQWHGGAMTFWCLLLISQATLIRWKKFIFHKWAGRISFVLVPIICFTGFHVAHLTLKNGDPTSNSFYFMVALMFNSIIVFATLYALAIWHRKNPVLHSRFMICTIFPLFTPVTDRLIYKYFREVIPLVPTLEGMPMVQIIGFGLADSILIIFVLWDGLMHKRFYAFPVALCILLLYQISVLIFYKFPFWQNFADWIMGLPWS